MTSSATPEPPPRQTGKKNRGIAGGAFDSKAPGLDVEIAMSIAEGKDNFGAMTATDVAVSLEQGVEQGQDAARDAAAAVRDASQNVSDHASKFARSASGRSGISPRSRSSPQGNTAAKVVGEDLEDEVEDEFNAGDYAEEYWDDDEEEKKGLEEQLAEAALKKMGIDQDEIEENVEEFVDEMEDKLKEYANEVCACVCVWGGLERADGAHGSGARRLKPSAALLTASPHPRSSHQLSGFMDVLPSFLLSVLELCTIFVLEFCGEIFKV